MIVKLALFILVAMLVIGLLGRWRRKPGDRTRGIERARKCPECGAYVLGKRPEPCGRSDCPIG